MISVIDVLSGPAGDPTVVMWHVHTSPDYPTSLMSGAWVLGPAESHGVDSLGSLLTNTWALPLTPAAAALVPAGIPVISLDDVRAAVEAGLGEIKSVIASAKQDNPKFVAPRFNALPTISPDDFRAAYHGEPQAETAWSAASAVAAWMQTWLDIEQQRRSRAYLKDALGSSARSLPLHLLPTR